MGFPINLLYENSPRHETGLLERAIASLGRAIWKYLMTWAGEPKTKELITTALGVQHNNCSLLVDAMVQQGVAVCVDLKKGLYQACPMVETQMAGIMEKIATDPKVTSQFIWTGYRIYYAVEYSYLSLKNKVLFFWEKVKLKTVFWLATIGVVAGWPVLSEYVKSFWSAVWSVFH